MRTSISQSSVLLQHLRKPVSHHPHALFWGGPRHRCILPVGTDSIGGERVFPDEVCVCAARNDLGVIGVRPSLVQPFEYISYRLQDKYLDDFQVFYYLERKTPRPTGSEVLAAIEQCIGALMAYGRLIYDDEMCNRVRLNTESREVAPVQIPQLQDEPPYPPNSLATEIGSRKIRLD